MSEIIEITIMPTTLGKRGQRYAAWLGGRRLGDYRTPFYGAARTLLAEGHSPDTILAMRHTGSSIVAMRGRIGEAAKLAVVEKDHLPPMAVRFAPLDPERKTFLRSQHPGPGLKDGLAGTGVAGDPTSN